MTVKTVHRLNAGILGLFIISHLSVHLTALAGIETHLSALDAVQRIYRNPVGETLLVIVILVQIVSGSKRLRFGEKDLWARLQVYSGIYLMIFLLMHTSAAIYTHHIFGLETDFYWAAGSLHYNPIKYGFAIYYFVGVLAFFTHLGAALHFALPERKLIPLLFPIFGVTIGCAIILTFSGRFFPIEIPQDVAAYYEKNFGLILPKNSK